MKGSLPKVAGTLSYLRPLDVPVFVLALALTLLGARTLHRLGSDAPWVSIRSPSQSWIYPLDTHGEFKVSGPLGDTWIVISQGQARISSSPCPAQTCVAAPALESPGHWVACLPNRVFMILEGAQGDIDAVAR
ncbi:MAG: NusG domain II-containing protein [Treponema sp.]|nr:NusG domain II-containing protein [Treponema sp.]